MITLDGYTANSELELLALRPAPVTMMMLGYQNSMGAPFVDYYISDLDTAPKANRDHYTENLVWLPYSVYSFNSHSSTVVDRSETMRSSIRKQFGLPDDAIVYINLGRHFKIDPPLLDALAKVCRTFFFLFF